MKNCRLLMMMVTMGMVLSSSWRPFRENKICQAECQRNVEGKMSSRDNWGQVLVSLIIVRPRDVGEQDTWPLIQLVGVTGNQFTHRNRVIISQETIRKGKEKKCLTQEYSRYLRISRTGSETLELRAKLSGRA